MQVNFRMGKSKRPPLTLEKTVPGPAAYDVPTMVGKGPKILLHGKRASDKASDIPGPGTYNPNHKSILESYPAIALSTGPRVEKDYSTRRYVPGPGHYKLNSTFAGPRIG